MSMRSCASGALRLAVGRLALLTAALATAVTLAALLDVALPAIAAAAEPASAPIDFNRDIRPILSDNCFQCHGPDAAQRQADLRLDTQQGMFGPRESVPVVVPGQPEKSELFHRITADDPEQRMPPADSGRALSAEQVQKTRQWIAAGARWREHWSFTPPQRPPLPPVRDTAWVRNPIDHFVLARLERENLRPSPPADRVTLIRRVTFDLTGLPPTPEEVDAFLADTAPGAYRRLVDRLLASPRWGERMAVRWLDAARYADTNGYQSDGERSMWRWRDWVIEAFNANMPFDQFTIEQLAGDLLPNPTLEQRLATGFNRNHRLNGEGGIIPEEFAVEYVVDRVDTTATVWLGLTLGCARCHDHKYDPFTQREFYQLYAYFNNINERGKAVKYGNSPPVMLAPTRQQRAQLAEVDQRLAAAEARFAELQAALRQAQAEWEKAFDPPQPVDWTIDEDLALHAPLDELPSEAAGKPSGKPAADAALRREGDSPPQPVPGKIHQAALLDGGGWLNAGDVGNFGFYDRFTLAAWIRPDEAHNGTILSRMNDTPEGYELRYQDGKLHVNLVKRWLDDAIRVETTTTLPPGRWYHVAAVYDGSRWADGVRVYLDGRPQPLKYNLDELNQSFASGEPFRIGSRGGGETFRGAIDEVRIYRRAVPAEEIEILSVAESISNLVQTPADQRSASGSRKLAAYYLRHHAPPAIRTAWQEVAALRRQRQALVERFPDVMVMQEMPAPRPTYVLQRGEYDKPAEEVFPGVPAALPPLPAGAPPNRLALARWLVDPQHPLTARVAVNRFWEMFFGTGLVRTMEDFGAQGEPPSHPELLDWLATEFVRSGWDMKDLARLIVTSACYRQSAAATPEQLQRDPDNRLLARGARFRLPAEMIRDQALAASGLLQEQLGGPSVMPYQPAGLWKELTGSEGYVQDHGRNLYRRSLYTFWKRTVAPPSMVTFDAALRETCRVRSVRTNTPLQALALLNDVTYIEAARVLAQRVLREADTTQARLDRAFRLATSRTPDDHERQRLLQAYDVHRRHFAAHPQQARQLIAAGEYPARAGLDPVEHAAFTAVCNLLLNLDEVINRP